MQVRNPGGLWDESLKLYAGSGGEPLTAVLEWRFPSGAKVKFAHLEHEKTVLEWQGAQLPLICFDELTHFSAAQFWSMTARNRWIGEVPPYIRATCNPDADSWVAELVAWWIAQNAISVATAKLLGQTAQIAAAANAANAAAPATAPHA